MNSILSDIQRALLRRMPKQNLSSLYPSVLSVWGQGGLLSGQTVEWVGKEYCGKTGMLRIWMEELYRYGLAIAWIDPSGCMEPDSFASMCEDRFWMVRATSEHEVFVCIEMIIRSGCFDVVVQEYPSSAPHKTVRRIQHLAKLHDVVLIWSHSNIKSPLSGQVAHRIHVTATPVMSQGALSEWSVIQLKVCATNIKHSQPSTIKTEMYLRGAATLPNALTNEYRDRSACVSDSDTFLGSRDA